MVTCEPYTSQQQAAWDDFVKNCKTPLFFFSRNFMEYHADRFVDASCLFYAEGRLVALLPATRDGDLLNSHGGLTYGGLLFSAKTRAAMVAEVLCALIQHAQDLGFKKIVYKAIPYFLQAQPAQEDLYFLFNQADAKLVRRDLSSLIHLDSRGKLSKGRKWLIARAKKEGLQVMISNQWAAFHQLLSLVLAKHKVSPVHSVAELVYLANLFPHEVQLKVVEKEGVLLAGTVLFNFGQTVHTQYIATSEEGKALGALDFLIETCIDEAQNQGARYFSFGVSTEEQGKILNAGLIGQKEGFGARGVSIDFYEIALPNS